MVTPREATRLALIGACALIAAAFVWLLLLRSFGALPAVRENKRLLIEQRVTIERQSSEIDSLAAEVESLRVVVGAWATFNAALLGAPFGGNNGAR